MSDKDESANELIEEAIAARRDLARAFSSCELIAQLADDGWIINVRQNALGSYDGRLLGKVEKTRLGGSLPAKYPSIAADAYSVHEVCVQLWAKAKTFFADGVK